MKALILGSGLSGKSAYQFLKSAGYEVSFATEEDINDGRQNWKKPIYGQTVKWSVLYCE